jgi:hypothetical protein
VGIIWLATDNGQKALDVATSKLTCYQYQSRDDTSIMQLDHDVQAH